MAFSLTGNYILDFALIQALSVFYLSDAALVLMKWRESENQAVRRLFEPPAAAWYEKAAGTNLKLIAVLQIHMKTTGYSIQVLSAWQKFYLTTGLCPACQVLHFVRSGRP